MTDFFTPPRQQQEPKPQTMKPKQEEQLQKRLCDYCNDTTALLYCRADSAKLCFSCDREVHFTNQLFSKHTRSLLCDACDISPASIFCETEHSVLCQNCDWERHRPSLSSMHNRRPIEGFSGCPSVSELLTFLGFEDLGNKKNLFFSEEGNGLVGSGIDGSGFEDGYSDLLVWESPAVVSMEDLIVSSDSRQNYQALGVPPLPKNRNAACGQHKEEVLSQLRELSKLEPDSNYENADVKPINVFQSQAAGQSLQPPNMYAGCEPDALPAYEESMLQWFINTGEAANEVFVPSTLLRSNFEDSSAIPDKWSDISGSRSHDNDGHGVQPVTARTPSVVPKVASHELNSQERDFAISRYKEKRKSRRYDKHIRYESRRLRAESRTRIKGRFAKMDHSNNGGNG